MNLYFDRFASALAASAIRALGTRGKALARSGGGLVLWKDSAETLIPTDVGVLARGSKDYGDCVFTAPIRVPKTHIPSHIDHADEDGWGDAAHLFHLLLSRELGRALLGVATELGGSRYLGDPDGLDKLVPLRSRDDVAIRRAIARAGVDVSNVAALASRCYIDAQLQRWLAGLAPKTPTKAKLKAKAKTGSTAWKRYDLRRLDSSGRDAHLSFQMKDRAVNLYVDHRYDREITRTEAEQQIEARKREGWFAFNEDAASRLDTLKRIGKAHRLRPMIALDIGRGQLRDATDVYEVWAVEPSAVRRSLANRLAVAGGSYDSVGNWLDSAHEQLHRFGPTGVLDLDPDLDRVKLDAGARAQLDAFATEVKARGVKTKLGTRVAGIRRHLVGTSKAAAVLWLLQTT